MSSAEVKINEILDSIDKDSLAEYMTDYAEGLQYDGDNILICKISLDNLKNEDFSEIEKLASFEYGDWDGVSSYVSEEEIERIKRQFKDDLEEFLEDEDSDVDDCSLIYSSFLYCDYDADDYSIFEYKNFVWGGLASQSKYYCVTINKFC